MEELTTHYNYFLNSIKLSKEEGVIDSIKLSLIAIGLRNSHLKRISIENMSISENDVKLDIIYNQEKVMSYHTNLDILNLTRFKTIIYSIKEDIQNYVKETRVSNFFGIFKKN